MKSREFVLDDGQTVITVYKRASSRKIRLSIDPSGEVRVSIPRWLPYKTAVDFARSKQEWIIKQKPDIKLLEDSQQLGKNHRLIFKQTDASQITTRLSDLEATVFYPGTYRINDKQVQQAARKVAKKALSAQARNLLPIRARQLAEKYNYSYKSISIKSTKSRWGSCDAQHNITLNPYLMELPWHLIDYVILHELNHTEAMHHGPDFWQKLESRIPKVKELRKELKSHRAIL